MDRCRARSACRENKSFLRDQAGSIRDHKDRRVAINVPIAFAERVQAEKSSSDISKLELNRKYLEMSSDMSETIPDNKNESDRSSKKQTWAARSNCSILKGMRMDSSRIVQISIREANPFAKPQDWTGDQVIKSCMQV